ncbi:PstS family phosphate ABC transporter substrate-binding protein [Klebsiella sp. MISC125]|uniref:PstS family phosphate ABC transporter substrate-binding protein n=1 Tax=Klebsiella sp. MISC125 TaxID=2755386 RepID=UPI003DA7BC09
MKRFLCSLLLSLVGVPLLAHGVSFLAVMLLLKTESFFTPWPIEKEPVIFYVPCAVVMLGLGWLWARFTRPEANSAARQCVLLVPALLVLIAWVLILNHHDLSFRRTRFYYYNYLMLGAFPWYYINLVVLSLGWLWAMVAIPVGTQICFTFGCYWRNRHIIDTPRAMRWRRIIVLLLVAFGIVAAWQAKLRADKYASVTKRDTVREYTGQWDYRPNIANSRLVALHGAPPFRFNERWPRQNGATAMYPLYASAFFALNTFPAETQMYEIERDYLATWTTPQAYEALIAGNADIIFVGQPSNEQKRRAQDAQLNLLYTPVAREAFVFITRADNPVDSLTQQQVRDIFSGKITCWCDVGGDDREIEVWQRPEGSGSQTAMLLEVMKDTPMLPAKETEVARSMSGIMRYVADYQNVRGAIGYTFRYYATKMNADKNIKLLAIDGIAPVVDNIRNGAYPYSVDFYMVTRENPTPETQKIVDWFVSPQGQRLVQDVGYVPLYKIQE